MRKTQIHQPVVTTAVLRGFRKQLQCDGQLSLSSLDPGVTGHDNESISEEDTAKFWDDISGQHFQRQRSSTQSPLCCDPVHDVAQRFQRWSRCECALHKGVLPSILSTHHPASNVEVISIPFVRVAPSYTDSALTFRLGLWSLLVHRKALEELGFHLSSFPRC